MASDMRIGERPRVPRSGEPHGQRRGGRARARLIRFTVRGVPGDAGDVIEPAAFTIPFGTRAGSGR